MRDYVLDFCGKYGFGELTEGVLSSFDKLMADSVSAARFKELLDDFTANPQRTREEHVKILEEAAKRSPVHEYSYYILYFICLSPWLFAEYEKKNIPRSVYDTTMKDLSAKVRECLDVYDVCGIFVPGWYCNMFKLKIFGFGRLQYEPGAYRGQECTIGNITVREGDILLYIHIPSYKEPFDRAARVDSYKKAYDFFRDTFDDGLVKFACSSWLLFPEHRNMLPESSNIIDFMNDFHLVSATEYDSKGNIWRIFGKKGKEYDGKNADILPENSSLQRAYKKHLKEGKPIANGMGIFIYDGERFIK